MIQSLEGKTAVLTGAGSGFGLECARLAATHGMKLVLVDVQQDALDRVEAELTAVGASVLAQKVDVSNAEQMEGLAAAVHKRFGAPHLLFNNAGVISGGLVWESSVPDWEWVLGVNLWGVIHGVRVFVPMMLNAAARDASYRGHIVNTSSMAGLLALPNMGIYNTTKAAVVNFTETLFHDLNLVTEQIGTSLLCPYFVPTGIASSQRNRPEQLLASKPTASQMIGQAMAEKAVESGKVTASDIARKVFDAVHANQFYVFSHPDALGSVRSRMDGIVSGTNPADPFLRRPDIARRLRDELRAAVNSMP
ncbi:SDR family oxidoreductase [Ottowia sp. VDI28]|uniref:SDR family oxidoreductase n=1 Tax=Ottowia sp. VDI28 TaxID=3133968 RepID=UPI003C2EAA91